MFTTHKKRHSFGYGVNSALMIHDVQSSNQTVTDNRLPWLSLSISLFVVLIGVLNNYFGLLEQLCFDRSSILDQQEYWRLITAHLVHSSNSHLFWDLLVFVPVAVYLEIKQHQLLILSLISSLIVINLYLFSPLADIDYYCGLSGVLYAAVGALALQLAKKQWQQQKKQLSGYLPLLLIVGKTVQESFLEQAIFMTGGWQVYYPAHWLGLACGITCCLFWLRFSSKAQQ